IEVEWQERRGRVEEAQGQAFPVAHDAHFRFGASGIGKDQRVSPHLRRARANEKYYGGVSPRATTVLNDVQAQVVGVRVKVEQSCVGELVTIEGGAQEGGRGCGVHRCEVERSRQAPNAGGIAARKNPGNDERQRPATVHAGSYYRTYRTPPALPAGVILPVHGPEIITVDVRVDLSRSQVGMTQHLLDCPQIGAALQEMRREGVAQGVWGDPLGNSRALGGLLDDAPGPDSGEWRAARVEEEAPAALPAVQSGPDLPG